MNVWSFLGQKNAKNKIFYGDPKILESVLFLAQFSLSFLSGILWLGSIFLKYFCKH